MRLCARSTPHQALFATVVARRSVLVNDPVETENTAILASL